VIPDVFHLRGRISATGALLAVVSVLSLTAPGFAARSFAAQRGATTQRGTPAVSDPSQALGDALTAACRQDQTAFASHLTSDNAQAYRALPEEQRLAMLRRFALLEDTGKPLLSALDGHTVVRCEASGMTSEIRFGPTEVRENLAFIAVTVPPGGPNQVESQSVRFGLVRESGEWKVLSVGLLLLDIPALARQWEAGDLQSRERSIANALRTIARALKSYQTAYGKLPEGLDQLGPPEQGGISPENAGLLDPVLAAGAGGGYEFRYSIVPAGGEDESERDKAAGFALAATPVKYGKDGRLSFFLDASGTLRSADKNGAAATSDDPRDASVGSQP
jgi:hypothetical protein